MKTLATIRFAAVMLIAVITVAVFVPASPVIAQQSALFPNELTDDGEVLGEEAQPTPSPTTGNTFGSDNDQDDSGEVAGAATTTGTSSVMPVLLILVAFIIMGLIFMALRKRSQEQQYQV